jgi:2-polyprenyl-3-methyl-5-hydroxy-6-metoxy-1,4-benzoquinol methylase
MNKDRFKEFYDDRTSWRNPKEEGMRFKKAIQAASVPKGAKVVDIGCRDGSLRSYLDKSVAYYGIDIAGEFKGESITIQDVTEGTSFENEFFDFVFCIDVLEHVRNPFFVLNEINRILKKEGTLILSVPNPYHFKEIIWNLFGIRDRQGHIFSWTRQTMQKLAQFCGFRLLRTSGTYLIPPIGCNNNMMTRSIIYKFQKAK